MTVKRGDMARNWVDPDEIPDLSTDEWAKVIEAALIRRDRSNVSVANVSTTNDLDKDVINAFKAEGPGWQGRINAALRQAVRLRKAGGRRPV